MHSWSNNTSPVLFKVKALSDYDHPSKVKRIYEGNTFEVFKETDSHYEIEVQVEIPDAWGVIGIGFVQETYPKEIFVKYDDKVNPLCTCGAAKIGYNKSGRAHSYWCVLHKE